MTFLQRLMKKLSVQETATKTEAPFTEELLDEDTMAGEWFVFRYKEGKWSKFGKGYVKEYLAFNALVEWQALFPHVEFKTGKEAPHACSQCH